MKPTLLACGLAAVSALACSGAADIPQTPDLRELLSRYESPTASLDATDAATAVRSVPQLEELAAGFRAAEFVMDDVDQASSTSSARTGERIRVQGSIGLKIRCPGDAGNPVFDESVNGSISLTLAVAENRIRRSFGGEARACILEGKIRDAAVRIVIDGPMAFDVGGDIGLGQRWSRELLASMPGTLSVAGFEFQSVSGRLTQGRFQYLLTLEGEKTVVLQLGDDGITVRDNGGVWFCATGEACAQR